MSHAVDRQEIIDLLYFGAAKPAQTAPREGSELYKEWYAKQFTEFDPELANKHLDMAGLDKRDDEGFRLGPDGKRFTLVFLVADVFRPAVSRCHGTDCSYAADVGLDIQVRATDRSTIDCAAHGQRTGCLSVELFRWTG